MKTIIDDLLQNEKEVCNFLDGIVERYRLNDFVMVDTTVKDFLTDRGREDFEAAYGCIYYHREKELYLNLDSVGDRLLSKYLDFLWGILPLEKEKDIVRYILAYHYLEMIEQMAFKLTISSGAPFLFWGYEISPQGKKRYDSYNKVKNEMLYEILPCLLEESLAKYSRMFHQYCYENASVKHYSLVEYLLKRENIFKTAWELDEEFVDMMDLFLFRYKVIFTSERLHIYMFDSARKKIIDNLIEI